MGAANPESLQLINSFANKLPQIIDKASAVQAALVRVLTVLRSPIPDAKQMQELLLLPVRDKDTPNTKIAPFNGGISISDRLVAFAEQLQKYRLLQSLWEYCDHNSDGKEQLLAIIQELSEILDESALQELAHKINTLAKDITIIEQASPDELREDSQLTDDINQLILSAAREISDEIAENWVIELLLALISEVRDGVLLPHTVIDQIVIYLELVPPPGIEPGSNDARTN